MTWKKMAYTSVAPSKRVLVLWSTDLGDMFAHGLVESRNTETESTSPKCMYLRLATDRADLDFRIRRNSLPLPTYGFRPKGAERYITGEDLGFFPWGGHESFMINLDRKRHAFYVAQNLEVTDNPGDEALYDALAEYGWPTRLEMQNALRRYYDDRHNRLSLVSKISSSEFLGSVAWEELIRLCTDVMANQVARALGGEPNTLIDVTRLESEIAILHHLPFAQVRRFVGSVQEHIRRTQARDGGEYFEGESQRIREIMKPAIKHYEATQAKAVDEMVASKVTDEAWDLEQARRRWITLGNVRESWAGELDRRKKNLLEDVKAAVGPSMSRG